jgi:hypothetical protein
MPFVIGGQNDNTGTPVGFNSGLTIGKVRVHDVALTPAQITAQFASESPQFYPAAYLSSSKILSGTSFGFTLNDVASSVVNPATLSVTVGGTRAGWQVLGGDGPQNGSLTSPALTVPNGSPLQLSLSHRYNFEGDGTPGGAYDGGVIQYSINGGEFTTLEDSNISQNGYFTSPIIGTGVLNGVAGFNGASAGFSGGSLITTLATIPGVVSGDVVKIRFLGAWDEGYSPDGLDWDIAGVTVTAGATTVLNQNFSTGNGGFTTAETSPVARWGFIANSIPTLGTLQAVKTGGVTQLTLPISWTPSRAYAFTITGKSSTNANLSWTTTLNTTGLLLGAPLPWPAVIPGPQGTANNWGVRTFLNNGINNGENLDAMIAFLKAAGDRTPTLTPDTVVDTQEPDLNFVDKDTNGNPSYGVLSGPRPFPGEALSRSTNAGNSRDDNHVVSSAHGVIVIPEESDYTFNISSDDGVMFRIRAASGPPPTFFAIDGNGAVDDAARNTVYFNGVSNCRAMIHLFPGTYKLEYATWEGGGAFHYQASVAKGFVPNDYDIPAWAAIGHTTTRTTPIPYPSMVGNWTVLSTPSNGLTVFTNPGADAAVDAAVAEDVDAATSSWDQLNFNDPEGASSSRLPGDSPFPRNTPANDDKFALRASGTLRIPETGSYLIGFQGDDGTRLTVGGVHTGFSTLVENATGAGIIGTGNTPVINYSSLGAVANSNPNTSITYGIPGALAGSSDTAINSLASDAGEKVTVPFNATMNPADPDGIALPFTVEAWAKPVNLTGGAQVVVNSMIAGTNQNPANGNDRSGYNLRLNNGSWQFYLGYENVYAQILTGADTALAGEWQHVVGVWDGTECRLYVNGALVASATPSTLPKANYAAPLYLGKRGFGDWRFNGGIDEVAVYSGVIDGPTINAHYANGSNAARTTPYPTLIAAGNPLAYYRLNETLAPRINLGMINTDVASGNTSTVGRIFLTAGDYPITTTFWENGGGASFEVFAVYDLAGATLPFRSLKNGGWPSVQDPNGLALTTPPTPVKPTITSGLTTGAGGALSLGFSSVPYATYSLQGSTDLQSWQNIDSLEASSSSATFLGTAGGVFSINPDEPRFMYRVLANP